ncbi:lipase secretion chaperone [Pyxidicoccus sp. MSG2]|uniref:lipase secretion chaperone n=1 Tax=Pyxidicoccus sp. MSG2 TaxID=2996790 RepID=UPI00226EB936|nr:lipase secretion chaperone [Pyxidicoccus sp. MSG2]MCY1017384.1 lipase secretion chaperone [Pyxidicoccus sp. MSG2]
MKIRPVAVVLALGAAIGAGVLGWLALQGEVRDEMRAASNATSPVRDAARLASGAAVARSAAGLQGDARRGDAALPPTPTSLQDTQEDGALRVDAEGHLVLSADVRLLFDYYLSATGEEPPEVIRARILAALREKLPPRAAEEAVRLLDDYRAYREATRALRVPPGSAQDDLGSRLEALRQLRREHLGDAAADAFFSAEEQVDSVSLERMKLERDTSLTREERERRIAALEEQLPPAMRAQREEALRPLRQQAEERELLATGATAEDLHQYRQATVGTEATEQLEALDRQRAEWKQRLEAFRAKREALRLSEPDAAVREAAVQRLLVDSFTPEERPRVQAADALDAERARQQGGTSP